MSTQQQCMVLNIPDWLKERKTLLHYWVARHEGLNWRVEKRLSEVSGGQSISRRREIKKHEGSRRLYSRGWSQRRRWWMGGRRRRLLFLIRYPAVPLVSFWSNLTPHLAVVNKSRYEQQSNSVGATCQGRPGLQGSPQCSHDLRDELISVPSRPPTPVGTCPPAGTCTPAVSTGGGASD